MKYSSAYYGTIDFNGPELSHHGVKGQKWYRRLYQYKDGRLTPLGRMHYGVNKRNAYLMEGLLKDPNSFKKWTRAEEDSYIATRSKKILKGKISADDKLHLDTEKRNLKEAGVKTGIFRDRVPKGSLLTRYSNSGNETMDDKRKYVSITKYDKNAYKDLAKRGFLYLDKNSDIFEYTLNTIRPLSIAKGKSVTDYLIKTYGNVSVNKYLAYVNKYNLRDRRTEIDRKTSTKYRADTADTLVYDYAYYAREKVIGEVQHILKDNKKMTEISKRYSKRGYDALVDPEDYMNGFDYPMILLNSKKSVRVKSIKKLK